MFNYKTQKLLQNSWYVPNQLTQNEKPNIKLQHITFPLPAYLLKTQNLVPYNNCTKTTNHNATHV